MESVMKKSDDTLQSGKPTAEGWLADQTVALGMVLLKLNIARLCLLLYPPGHKEAQKNVTVAHHYLSRIISTQRHLFIEVSDNTLMANNRPMAKDNTAIREIIMSLSRHDIHTVLFKPGLTPFDVLSFLERLAQKPATDRFSLPISNIDIGIINYSGYTLITKKTISVPDSPREAPEPGRSTAQGKPGLFSVRPDQAESLVFEKPTRLGDRINRNAADAREVMNSYSTLLQNLQDHAALEQGNTLRADYLKTFLYSLNPSLREQFLSLTLDHALEKNSVEELYGLLTSLDHYLIFKMLEKANQEKREISPSMLRMVQKVISTIDTDTPSSSEKQAGSEVDIDPNDDLHHLFNREKYEMYVEQDYDTVLKNLLKISRETSRTPESINIADQERSLESTSLETQLIRMILSLDTGTEKISHDYYQFFSLRLSDSLIMLLDAREIVVLMTILGRLRRHHRRHPDPVIRDHAAKALLAFMQPLFLNRAMAAMDGNDLSMKKKTSCLLYSLGTGILPELLAWCGEQTDLFPKQSIRGLVSMFGQAAVAAIESVCDSPNPFFLKNMTTLLASCRTEASIPLLKQLYESPHADVRIEALKSLISLDCQEGIDWMMDLLSSPDNPLFYRAVQAAADLRLVQAVPELVKHLPAVTRPSSGLESAKILIKTLAAIGSPTAIPALENILNRTWSLHPRHLLLLKEAIYTTLDGYGPEVRSRFLTKGLTSRNQRISELCGRLIKTDEP